MFLFATVQVSDEEEKLSHKKKKKKKSLCVFYIDANVLKLEQLHSG